MSDIKTDILAQDAKRREAMIRRDLKTLDGLLHERLRYAHSNADVDDKPIYMKKMDRPVDYKRIEWKTPKVTAVSSDVALITGPIDITVRVNGNDRMIYSDVLAVWTKERGSWQLIAYQSTPRPPDA